METKIQHKINLLSINIKEIKIFINSYNVSHSLSLELIKERQQCKKQLKLLQKQLERSKKLERINRNEF